MDCQAQFHRRLRSSILAKSPRSCHSFLQSAASDILESRILAFHHGSYHPNPYRCLQIRTSDPGKTRHGCCDGYGIDVFGLTGLDAGSATAEAEEERGRSVSIVILRNLMTLLWMLILAPGMPWSCSCSLSSSTENYHAMTEE